VLDKEHPKDLKVLKELSFDYQVAGTVGANLYFAGRAGDPATQEESLRKAIATDEVTLLLSPQDFDVQHAYAVDLEHLGVILTYHAKDLNAALECYKKDLEIEQKLRQGSPETRYARGVAAAYSHVGQAYDRLGDAARSVENFAQGLEVSKELVRADPKNTLFQQGLAIAYANTANELSKTGRFAQSTDYVEKSDQIMRTLVASAPENKQQRGILAAILLDNGITLGNSGRLDAALKHLEEARASFESLEKTDSLDHRISIRALTCTEKMGEAASRAGNSKLAADYLHQVLKEVEPELARQNADASVPYLAADSYSGLGDLELRRARQSRGNAATQKARWTQARVWYLKSMQAWRRVDHPLPVAPSGFDAGDPAKVETKLQLCEAALAKLEARPQ